MYDACPYTQLYEPLLYDDVLRPALCTSSSIVVGVGTVNNAVSPPISKRKADDTIVSYAARLPSPLWSVWPAENQPANWLSHVDHVGCVVVNRRRVMEGGRCGGGGGTEGGGRGGQGGGSGGEGIAGGTMLSKA